MILMLTFQTKQIPNLESSGIKYFMVNNTVEFLIHNIMIWWNITYINRDSQNKTSLAAFEIESNESFKSLKFKENDMIENFQH